jgi:hypothetical protein
VAARTASFCCCKGSVPTTSTRSRTDGGLGHGKDIAALRQRASARLGHL